LTWDTHASLILVLKCHPYILVKFVTHRFLAATSTINNFTITLLQPEKIQSEVTRNSQISSANKKREKSRDPAKPVKYEEKKLF
jgi:hypothetical protein